MSAKSRSRATKMSTPGHKDSARYVVCTRLAGACVLVALVLAIAFIALAPVLGPSRLSSTTYYLVVSVLGLLAGGSLYGVFWSHDHRHRRHFGIGLEIGGPIAVLVMVLLLALLLPGPNPGFPLAVVVHREAEPNEVFPKGSGQLVLDLGTRQIRRPFDTRGKAVFSRIPEALLGQEVGLSLESDTYTLTDPNHRVLLDGKNVDLTVLKKP
jgi:hypothetical protein